MRKRVLKICTMFMALILLISSETQHAIAKEPEIGGNLEIGNIEINLPDHDTITADKNLSVNELAVETNENEIVLYSPAEIQTLDMDDESTIYYGTVSGYLSQTGEYALYSVNLSAGNYLQARLTLPNNNSIDYDLVLYDSALAAIKTSDYYTFLNETGTLEESIGYKAATDEQVHIGVFSVGGGSDTEAYTLDFAITTNFSDNSEPNENAKEAIALTVNTSETSVSGKLNSPIDNDWYVFTVLDSPQYDRIRLNITSNSATNGCMLEIYRNLTSDGYYAMQFLGSGTEGEVNLPAGTYYLRIVSTNTFNNFDYGGIPTYNLSVSSVPRVDEIAITNFSSPNGSGIVGYPEGRFYLINEGPDDIFNYVIVIGMAYTLDDFGNRFRAANVKIDCTVTDEQWEKDGRYDLAFVSGSTVTDSEGVFRMIIGLNPAKGGIQYDNGLSWHYYDLMRARITTPSNSSTENIKYFYLFKKSIIHSVL